MNGAEGTVTPPLASATEALNEIGVVLIVEHYDASLCLFEYRALGFLTPHCTCAARKESSRRDHHESHGVPKHSIDDVDAKTARAMRSLVEVDTALYAHALERFKAEVREVFAATGVDLLCEEEERTGGRSEKVIEADIRAGLQVLEDLRVLP